MVILSWTCSDLAQLGCIRQFGCAECAEVFSKIVLGAGPYGCKMNSDAIWTEFDSVV